MLDWNDEELSNIIWDEVGESDDHIVPYTEANEDICKDKKWGQQATNANSAEQAALGSKVDINGRKMEGSSKFDLIEGTSASGFGADTLPNLSLSNAAKTDQDTWDTSVSNNLTEITKFDSSGVEDAAQLNNDTKIFQNPYEGKEQGDFVDYGWANIGSFDDLDRIFSNDDPVFGNVTLGNPDELWSSSKDVSNSAVTSFPLSVDSPSLGLGVLRSKSESFEFKKEYVQDNDQTFTASHGKDDDPATHGLQNTRAILNPVEYVGGKRKPVLNEETSLMLDGKRTKASSQLTSEDGTSTSGLGSKVYRQKRLFQNRKKVEEKNEAKFYAENYSNWSSPVVSSGQFKNHFGPPMLLQSPSQSTISQQRQLQGSKSLQYQHIVAPTVAPSLYSTFGNLYSMPMMSHTQSEEPVHQSMLSGYDVPYGDLDRRNKLLNSSLKSQSMTPQEKIEKLRRRQQMQALLAIQKQQQQQFGHQGSSSDQSKCSQENPVHNVEGVNLEIEDLSTIASFDPNSPLEQDDSFSLPVEDYSREHTILYRLQSIIAKMDLRVRLSIRDSLFRLAQSVTQRHYAGDTGSTNNSGRDEHMVAKEEAGSYNRNVKMAEAETETNPIDRAVAHLLFHRPLEVSGKHQDWVDSPHSETFSLSKFATGSLPGTPKNQQNSSLQGSIGIGQPAVDTKTATQCKTTSQCLETSENASSNAASEIAYAEAPQ